MLASPFFTSLPLELLLRLLLLLHVEIHREMRADVYGQALREDAEQEV
jgi:hypothetical protein